MHLSELKAQHVSQLIEMAIGLEIENPQRLRKQELMFAILKRKAKTGETIFGDGVHRRIDGLTVLDYPMPRGAVAGYYPELNPLIPLDYYDRTSGTPAAKSIPVRIVV